MLHDENSGGEIRRQLFQHVDECLQTTGRGSYRYHIKSPGGKTCHLMIVAILRHRILVCPA